MGGAGLYSLAMSVIVEITPLQYIGVSSGLLGSVFVLSSLLGPVLGGLISSTTTWRWIFYLKQVRTQVAHITDRLLVLTAWQRPPRTGNLFAGSCFFS